MLDFINLDFHSLLQKIFVILSPCCFGLFLFYFIGALVALVSFHSELYFELEPLLLWFYFIWGPCCSCLFRMRAIVALVLFYLGP